MTRNLAGIVFATGILGLSSPVRAEDGRGAAVAEPAFRIAVQLDWLAAGSGVFTSSGYSSKMGMADAYAIGGFIDYALTPHVSIGVAPRLVYNIGASAPDADTNEEELDLRARICVRTMLSADLEFHASLAPGYAKLIRHEFEIRRSSGVMIGGALGLAYGVSSQLFVTGEIGYQRSFTTTAVRNAEDAFSFDLDLSYVQLGMGAGLRF